MSASKVTVQAENMQRAVSQGEKRPPRRQMSKAARPYVFIAPAVVFEFFIHILPMAIGIGISLLGLALFYVHY